MRPQESISRLIRATDSGGVAITTLTVSDFTVTAYARAYGAAAFTTWSPSATLTHLGSGFYDFQVTLPSSAGYYALKLVPTASTTFIDYDGESGEVENQDLDSIYGSLPRSPITIQGSGTIGDVRDLSIVNKRYVTLVFGFEDVNGDPVDMTSGTNYENYVFGVRDKNDQTLTPPKLDAVHGTPTGFSIVGASGTVTVTIPEDASFFVLDEGASPDADGAEDLKYELTADVVGTSGQTVALIKSSTLTITRREVGT